LKLDAVPKRLEHGTIKDLKRLYFRAAGEPMSIYLLGAEKGGCGKTTTAVHVAAALALRGRDVLLLDTDTSGDAAGWVAQRRERSALKPVQCARDYGQVAATIRDAAKRYQDIVVDAGGRDSVELRSAMTAADVLLMPTCPSQFDLWQVSRVAALIDQARAFNPSLAAFAVINRASTNWTSAEAKEAAELIGEFPQLRLAATVLHDRKSYRDAVREGRAVFELEQSGAKKAAEEMWSLFAELTGESTPAVEEAGDGVALLS
jgi:chromosome partitioning protein